MPRHGHDDRLGVQEEPHEQLAPLGHQLAGGVGAAGHDRQVEPGAQPAVAADEAHAAGLGLGPVQAGGERVDEVYDRTLALPSSKRTTATPSSMVVVTGRRCRPCRRR